MGTTYRPGFAPRPGESDIDRLKRETDFLKSKQAAKARKRDTEQPGFLDREAKRLTPAQFEKRYKTAAPIYFAPDGTRRNAKGGKVKKYAKGGSVSARADGCATKGKTRGKMV